MNKSYVLKIMMTTGIFLGCSLKQAHLFAHEHVQNPCFEAVLNPSYDHEKLVIYKTLDKQKHSYISFMKDDQDHRYVVKQDRSFSIKAHFLTVFEMVSAYMAECFNISAHHVGILPIGLSFPGKIFIERPATIHSFVPGYTLREKKPARYSNFSIKQGGQPFSKKKGFNKRTIECMARNKYLPAIVALDTFVANRDRNKANVIYDEKDDRFYAIDMALIFDLTHDHIFLPEVACSNVKDMIANKVLFTPLQLKAIEEYQKTLLLLLEKFPPKEIYSLMDTFIMQVGLREKYSDAIIRAFLEKYIIGIERAYKANKHLVTLLSQLSQQRVQ